jgi:Fe2+ transport system protein FeoA
MAVRIKQIDAPPETAKRLREIGFCEEQVIRLLNRQSNLVCQICNARMAIGAKLGDWILVAPVTA